MGKRAIPSDETTALRIARDYRNWANREIKFYREVSDSPIGIRILEEIRVMKSEIHDAIAGYTRVSEQAAYILQQTEGRLEKFLGTAA